MSQCNLHQHSEGSFLDGLARVTQIAARAVELGSPAVAITDHNEVNQHFAFQKACRAAGVHPILGIEADWVYDMDETRKLGYPKNRSHVCLLAENNVGLSNVWALASLANTKRYKYKKPLLTLELMREYRQGLWASDGCMITELGRAVEAGDEQLARQHFSAMLDVFGDRFYSELHTWQFMEANTDAKRRLNTLMTDINQAKLRFASEMGVPLVVVNDAHHCWPHEWENKELIWKMSTSKKSKGDDQDGGEGDEYGQKADHLMGDEELYYWMARHGVGREIVAGAIDNAEAIAELCHAEVTKTLDMPRLTASDAEDLVMLEDAVAKGFKAKVIDRGLPAEEYAARVDEEMRLITDKGFAGYFNMEKDLVDACVSGQWAPFVKGRSKPNPMLVGPGRGSAGGCLVAYLLGITSLDPIHYDLMFERFLDPGRDDNPDIDVDFPQSLRTDGAKAYLEHRYGHDHVCTIQTLNRSKPKQILRDLGRALKVDLGHVNKMAKIIEQVQAIDSEVDEGDDEASWDEVLEKKGGELFEWAKQYPELFQKINEFFAENPDGKRKGQVRQSGRHPSGVLVANKALLGRMPTRTRHDEPGAITQFDMYEVEEMGAVKMDLLGLRHLDTLMHARNLVYERHGVWLDYRDDRLPMDLWGAVGAEPPAGAKIQEFTYDEYADSAIWPQVAAGHTLGFFQLESAELTRTCQSLKPQNEVDVAAAISIVRPGVKDAGLDKVYLARRNGHVNVEYDHPLLKAFTEETFGVLIYQEQLMIAAKQLAGFTPSEASGLRRALSKKKMDDVLAYKDQFMKGCTDNEEFTKVGWRGNQWVPTLPMQAAEKIWRSIEASGRYAFNKSHAVGYALIPTWEVWTKHYYPIEFMCALKMSDAENINRYVRESRRLGFKVLPPDINLSGPKFTLGPVGSQEIRYGLGALRGLGAAASAQIDAGRPYADLADYCARGGKKGADKTSAYNLLRIGAFDSMGTRDEMLTRLEYERAKEGLAPSTLANPEKLEARIEERLANPSGQWLLPRPDFTDPDVIYQIEQELCGNHILVDPMEPYLGVISENCVADPADVDKFERKAEFAIGGQLTEVKQIVIQKEGRNKGREMAFLTVQWNEQDFEVTVFPDTWTECRDLLATGVPVMLWVARDDRGCHLKALERLDLLRRQYA